MFGQQGGSREKEGSTALLAETIISKATSSHLAFLISHMNVLTSFCDPPFITEKHETRASIHFSPSF